MDKRRICAAVAIVVAALTGAAAGAADDPIVIRAMGVTGQPAWGAGEGVVFSEFKGAVVDASGNAAFWARLTGDGVDSANDAGIWRSSRSGELELIVREGQPAPQTGEDILFTGLYAPAIGSNGAVGFEAKVYGPGVVYDTSFGIWLADEGGLRRVARGGDQVPGARPGLLYKLFDSPFVDGAGGVHFDAELTGAGVDADNRDALCSETAGTVVFVAREQDACPDAGAWAAYGTIYEHDFDQTGRAAFRGPVRYCDGSTANAIWSQTTGPVHLVGMAGEHVPGQPSSVKYESLYSVAAGDNGEIAFRASLEGSGVSSANNQALLVGGRVAARIVAREGDPAPGLPAGGTFSSVGVLVDIDQAGRAVFSARIAGGSGGTCLYAETDTGIAPLAYPGQQAPGFADGVTYATVYSEQWLEVNRHGDVAFLASLTGPGIDSGNDFGLWAEIDDEIRLIVREGDQIEVAPGETRTVKYVRFQDGWEDDPYGRSAFSDSGWITFSLTFDDGTNGVFAAIPEPATFCLLALGAGVMLRRPRRRMRGR